MKKRYQYYGKDGIEWTDWFNQRPGYSKDKWQVKNKLLNEYKED